MEIPSYFNVLIKNQANSIEKSHLIKQKQLFKHLLNWQKLKSN